MSNVGCLPLSRNLVFLGKASSSRNSTARESRIIFRNHFLAPLSGIHARGLVGSNSFNLRHRKLVSPITCSSIANGAGLPWKKNAISSSEYHPLEDLPNPNPSVSRTKLSAAEVARTIAEANEDAIVFRSVIEEGDGAICADAVYVVDHCGDIYLEIQEREDFTETVEADQTCTVFIGFGKSSEVWLSDFIQHVSEDEMTDQPSQILFPFEQDADDNVEVIEMDMDLVEDGEEVEGLDEDEVRDELEYWSEVLESISPENLGSLGAYGGLETLQWVHPMDFAYRIADNASTEHWRDIEKPSQRVIVKGILRRATKEELRGIDGLWENKFGMLLNLDDDDEDEDEDEDEEIERGENNLRMNKNCNEQENEEMNTDVDEELFKAEDLKGILNVESNASSTESTDLNSEEIVSKIGERLSNVTELYSDKGQEKDLNLVETYLGIEGYEVPGISDVIKHSMNGISKNRIASGVFKEHQNSVPFVERSQQTENDAKGDDTADSLHAECEKNDFEVPVRENISSSSIDTVKIESAQVLDCQSDEGKEQERNEEYLGQEKEQEDEHPTYGHYRMEHLNDKSDKRVVKLINKGDGETWIYEEGWEIEEDDDEDDVEDIYDPYPLFKLEILSIQLDTSSGYQENVDVNAWCNARPDFLAHEASYIIEKANSMDAAKICMAHLCRRKLNLTVDHVHMVAIDRLGVDLRVQIGRQMKTLRFPFRHPASNVMMAEKLLDELLRPRAAPKNPKQAKKYRRKTRKN